MKGLFKLKGYTVKCWKKEKFAVAKENYFSQITEIQTPWNVIMGGNIHLLAIFVHSTGFLQSQHWCSV